MILHLYTSEDRKGFRFLDAKPFHGCGVFHTKAITEKDATFEFPDQISDRFGEQYPVTLIETNIRVMLHERSPHGTWLHTNQPVLGIVTRCTDDQFFFTRPVDGRQLPGTANYLSDSDPAIILAIFATPWKKSFP
jgi:hypothetical protein